MIINPHFLPLYWVFITVLKAKHQHQLCISTTDELDDICGKFCISKLGIENFLLLASQFAFIIGTTTDTKKWFMSSQIQHSMNFVTVCMTWEIKRPLKNRRTCSLILKALVVN